jgi:hypothetical protein
MNKYKMDIIVVGNIEQNTIKKAEKPRLKKP